MSAEKTPTTETPAPAGTVNASTAIARYEPLEASIAAFLDKHQNVVHDVTTTAGLAAAKQDRAECRSLRLRVEDARVAEKADALAYGRKVDAEAKRLTAIIAPAEDGYDGMIKAEEARKESERQARIDYERRRIATIRERIDGMKKRAANALGMTADEAEAELRTLIADDPIAASGLTAALNYAEFYDEAVAAHAGAVDFLRELVDKKRRTEAEAADLARQRAELDAKQEQLDRDDRERVARVMEEQRIEDERRAAAEKKEREERDAADARRRDELRAEEARIAEARKQLDAQKEAQAEEQRRIDAQNAAAEQRRKDEEERQAAAKRDEEARAAAAREAEEAQARAAAEAERREKEERETAAQRADERCLAIRLAVRGSPRVAIDDILLVVIDPNISDADARYKIGIICEANLPKPSEKAKRKVDEAAAAELRG